MTEQGAATAAALATRDELGLAQPLPVMSDDEITRLWRQADALAKSGFYKDARQATQAFAKVMYGRDLGLSPTEAMSAIHIIEGKPEMSGNLQASRVKMAPGYDYEVVELTNAGATIRFTKDGEQLGVSEFTIEDAQRAELAKKDVWKKYPRNMCFNRAISNGVAWYCPEVMGGLRVYDLGEVETGYDVVGGSGGGVGGESLPDSVAKWAPDEETAGAVVGIITRARAIGHAGLGDLPAAEMSLSGQPEERVQEWLWQATKELERVEAKARERAAAEAAPDERVEDAVVVPDEAPEGEPPPPGPGDAPGVGEEADPEPPPDAEALARDLTDPQKEALGKFHRGEEAKGGMGAQTIEALYRRGLLDDDGLSDAGRAVAAHLFGEVPSEAPTAPVEPDPPPAEDPGAELERGAAGWDAEAEEMDAQGNADGAASARAEAQAMRDEAEALRNPQQDQLGL